VVLKMNDHQEVPWRDRFDHWKADQEAQRPFVEMGARFAELAIKSLLIISGGAAVALGGFAKSDPTNVFVHHAFVSSAWWFAVAAFGSVITAGLSYLSMAFAVDARDTSWGPKVAEFGRVAGIIVFILSLVFFGWGAYLADSALRAQPLPQSTPVKK
jgi:hypothetical protein